MPHIIRLQQGNWVETFFGSKEAGAIDLADHMAKFPRIKAVSGPWDREVAKWTKAGQQSFTAKQKVM